MKREHQLGSGAFSSVYQVEEDGKWYALKITQASELHLFAKEFEFLSKADHPNIIKCYRAFTLSNYLNLYLLLELGKTNLYEMKGRLSKEQIDTTFRSLFGALAYLEKSHLVNLDVKSSNLLLFEDGSVKMIDFNLIEKEGRPIGDSYTLWYRSPEVNRNSCWVASHKSDIFAAGCALYEIITGKTLFPADSKYDLQRRHERFDGIPEDALATLGAPYASVIDRCLQHDPADRPNASELVDASSIVPLFVPSLSLKELVTSVKKRLGKEGQCSDHLIAYTLTRLVNANKNGYDSPLSDWEEKGKNLLEKLGFIIGFLG